MMHRWALLLCLVPAVSGCGAGKTIKEKLNPKASISGVSIVNVTPDYVTLKVDVKTEDVELMLGMVKLKYKFSMIDATQEQANDSVLPNELVGLSDSGFAFLVKVPIAKAGADNQKYDYLIQGSIVFKVIAKIADVPFSYRGAMAFTP
jgi:hypothetical protein